VRMGSVSKVEANAGETIDRVAITTGAKIHCQNKANAVMAKVTRKGLLAAKVRHDEAIKIIPGKSTM